jgi:Family of unknown function (DUF5681)
MARQSGNDSRGANDGGSENTAGKQRGKPFKPGKSGNPAGKPKGCRNAATLAMEALLDGESETLTRKAIELAKGGDMAALRLCLDRIMPPRKDRPVTFALPAIASTQDAAAAMASILAGVSCGDITPGEGAEISKLVDSYVRVVEATELHERISRLERAGQTK